MGKEQWEKEVDFISKIHKGFAIDEYLSQGWHKKDGTCIPYSNMSKEYLINCINLIKRKGVDSAYLPYLEAELSKR